MTEITSRHFLCEGCAGYFTATEEDPVDEARLEYEREFGRPLPPPDQRRILCDNCYQRALAWLYSPAGASYRNRT